MKLPRFRLRTLFIAITAICLLFGSVAIWYRVQEAEYQRQIELSNKLQEEGATIGWQRQIAPKWLRWIGRAKDFRRIKTVYGWPVETLTDDDFAWLDSLEACSLAIPADKLLSDSLVSRLATLTTLKELMILPPSPGDKSVSDKLYYVEMPPTIISKLPSVHVVVGKIEH